MEERRGARSGVAVRAGLWLVIVAAGVVLASGLPVDQAIVELRGWVAGRGVRGMAELGLAYALGVLLFVPGAALTLIAGAAFGPSLGTGVVSLASTMAAAVAFLIARHLARDRVEALARRHPTFAVIDQAVADGGWRIVALLRLSPVVPYSASNYLYGLTRVRFVPYVLASWVCMLPATFAYVYLGHLGAEGLDAGRESAGEWALLAVGLVATVVAALYLVRLGRRALAERQALPAVAEASGEDPGRAAPGRRGTFVLAGVAAASVAAAAWLRHDPRALTDLFGPPAIELSETWTDVPGSAALDHALLENLLRTYVDGDGAVDYVGLARRTEVLDAYLAQMGAAPWDALDRDERLALLINVYNAATLRLVLEHYPLGSIKDLAPEQRWKARRWRVAGAVRSLDEIEHELLRPNFREPRLHFAIVCAARGCPPLRREAYVAARIEEQLDAQARYVHGDERWFAFDPETNTVRLSRLYEWFAGDFEQVGGSVLGFVARYSGPLRAALERGDPPRIVWQDYDWSLNER